MPCFPKGLDLSPFLAAHTGKEGTEENHAQDLGRDGARTLPARYARKPFLLGALFWALKQDQAEWFLEAGFYLELEA
jgi:hypothetical protein